MRPTYIYGLRDPRDGLIHYIGKANTPKSRLEHHMRCEGANKRKNAWLTDLKAAGLLPTMDILECIMLSEWQEAERRWIANGRAQGWPLTNISAGGGGMTQSPVYVSPWIDIIADYLMPHERLAFAMLPEHRQFVICHNAAKAMMYHSHIAIKMRGGDPGSEFDSHKMFWMGSRTARILLQRETAGRHG